MGLKNGLPLGIQVVAAPNQDRLCFAVARELERTFGGYVPPFKWNFLNFQCGDKMTDLHENLLTKGCETIKMIGDW